MWWICQLIATSGCAVKHGFLRVFGFSWWMILLLLAFGVIIEGGFWLSMQTAKSIGVSFLRVWFLGTASLAVFGALTSLIYFKESVTIPHIIGASLATIGAILLVR